MGSMLLVMRCRLTPVVPYIQIFNACILWLLARQPLKCWLTLLTVHNLQEVNTAEQLTELRTQLDITIRQLEQSQSNEKAARMDCEKQATEARLVSNMHPTIVEEYSNKLVQIP
jgi:hypothetical protein